MVQSHKNNAIVTNIAEFKSKKYANVLIDQGKHIVKVSAVLAGCSDFTSKTYFVDDIMKDLQDKSFRDRLLELVLVDIYKSFNVVKIRLIIDSMDDCFVNLENKFIANFNGKNIEFKLLDTQVCTGTISEPSSELVFGVED